MTESTKEALQVPDLQSDDDEHVRGKKRHHDATENLESNLEPSIHFMYSLLSYLKN